MSLNSRFRSLALVVSFVCLLFSSRAFAGGGPEGVAVVVNAESWASQAVANEYIHLRKIPPLNVIYLSGLPTFETIGVEDFREKILKPVMLTLAQRGVAPQIDCITYSSDIPYAVEARADANKDQMDKLFPGMARFLATEASINSMTYLYELVLAKDIHYFDLGINWYFPSEPRGAGRREKRWSDAEGKDGQAVEALLREKKYAEALPLLEKLRAAHPDSADVAYRVALCSAQLKKMDDALAALESAVEHGYTNWPRVENAEEFRALRGKEAFTALIEKMKKAKPAVPVPDARAFDSNIAWKSPRDGGQQHYVLSTMLAVTSGRGNSVSEALSQLRRSASCDGVKPAGTVYFMANSDVRSTTREWAFTAAAAKLNAMSVPADIIWGVLPQKKKVAGLVVGAADFNWGACGSSIDAGAICEHLTSYGGIMRDSGQTPLTEFLRAGAAGASGTVTEPFAIQAKFPSPFIQVYYAQGASLAEAFYMSVSGPYQLLIVGDPLCQPWATIPDVQVKSPSEPVKGTLKLEASVKQKDLPIASYELFVDGRRTASSPSSPLELDTTKLSDGYHEIRVVAIAANAVRTQGREIFPIVVANGAGELKITGPEQKEIAYDGPRFSIAGRMAGAKRIVFTFNGTEIGRLNSGDGKIEVDPRQLGQGPVKIHATATVEGEKGEVTVAAAPLELTIIPPFPLEAVKLAEGAKLAKGVQITLEKGEKVVVEQAIPNWLAAAGVKAKEKFVIEGYLQASADDVYQFQVNAASPLALEVDGVALRPSGAAWKFAPVTLAKGLHKFTARGTASDKLDVEIRFGGSGAYNILGCCQHVAIEGERVIQPPAPKSQPASASKPATAPATGPAAKTATAPSTAPSSQSAK